MELLLVGLCTAFNFIVIVWKFRKARYADACLDLGIMTVICFMFSGSYSAIVVGMVASMCVSIYLWFSPVKLIN